MDIPGLKKHMVSFSLTDDCYYYVKRLLAENNTNPTHICYMFFDLLAYSAVNPSCLDVSIKDAFFFPEK